MDVHPIGGPQRSAKSFYSSQSLSIETGSWSIPCGLADRAVSIDRRDCGGANSLLLQRGHALPMVAGQRARLPICSSDAKFGNGKFFGKARPLFLV
jgi:hypothetical protein